MRKQHVCNQLERTGGILQTSVKLSLAEAAHDTGLSVSASWHRQPWQNHAWWLMDHKGLLGAASQLELIQQCNTNPLVQLFCVSEHGIQTTCTMQAPCSKTQTYSPRKSSGLGNTHKKAVTHFIKRNDTAYHIITVKLLACPRQLFSTASC